MKGSLLLPLICHMSFDRCPPIIKACRGADRGQITEVKIRHGPSSPILQAVLSSIDITKAGLLRKEILFISSGIWWCFTPNMLIYHTPEQNLSEANRTDVNKFNKY